MFGEAFHEIENLDVPLRVAQDRIEFLQLEKTDVTMMILDGFLLKLCAILRRQAETFFAVVLGAMPFQAGFKMFEKRFVTVWLFAIGSAHGVHLQNAKIDAELDLFFAVFAFKFPNDDLPGLIVPRVEQMRNVEIHRCGN
jgi:hypothetical protein